MTRIFKTVLMGATLVGLLLAPLGLAQADESITITQGSIGPVPVPKTGSFAPFDFTVAGQRFHNGMVDNQLGGSLTLLWDSTAWVPTIPVANLCEATEVGYMTELVAKRPDGYLKLVFTATDGHVEERTIDPGPVPKGARATLGLCAQ
jgi:hypothetical protein